MCIGFLCMPAHRPRPSPCCAAGGATLHYTQLNAAAVDAGYVMVVLTRLKQQNSACSLFPLLLPPGLMVEGAGLLQAWRGGFFSEEPARTTTCEGR